MKLETIVDAILERTVIRTLHITPFIRVKPPIIDLYVLAGPYVGVCMSGNSYSKTVSTNSVTNVVTTDETDEDVLSNAKVYIVKTSSGAPYEYPVQLDEGFRRINLLAGTYELRFESLHISPTRVTADVCVGYKDYKVNFERFIYGGGVRIKEVLFKENDATATTPSTKIRYQYGDGETLLSSTGTRSSGAVDGNLAMLERDYVFNEKQYLFRWTAFCCPRWGNSSHCSACGY